MIMIYTFLFIGLCLNFQYTYWIRNNRNVYQKYNLAISVVEPPVKNIEWVKIVNIQKHKLKYFGHVLQTLMGARALPMWMSSAERCGTLNLKDDVPVCNGW